MKSRDTEGMYCSPMIALSGRWIDNSCYFSMVYETECSENLSFWLSLRFNIQYLASVRKWGTGTSRGSSLIYRILLIHGWGLVSNLFPGLNARHLSFDCCQSFLKFAGFSTDEFISRFSSYFMEKTLDEEKAMKNTAVPLFTRMELCQGTWSLIRQWGKSLKTKPRRQHISVTVF